MIASYFHPQYTQHIDGRVLNYAQFVEYIKQLKEAVHSVIFDFMHLIAENNAVCSVHIAKAIKTDGDIVKAKVIAYFEIKDGLIYRCDELTYLLQND